MIMGHDKLYLLLSCGANCIDVEDIAIQLEYDLSM